MKKLILVFVAIAITAGAYAQSNSSYGIHRGKRQNITAGTYAQADSTKRKMSPPDMNKTQKQDMQNNPVDKSSSDGVMMQNGKMMKVKNGQSSSLDNDFTMSNGTKIMSDGTCIKKDGTKMKLKEGQHMDMSGNLIPTKTNKDKNMELVPDSSRKKNK